MLPTFYARKKIDANDKEAILVDKISHVSEPAIEQNFIAMEKAKTKKVFLNDEKTCLVGPVLIPELDILRYDEKIGYYQLRYDKEVIQDCMNKFVAGGLTGESNIEHSDNSKIEGVYADNWIITETNQYKAKALGFGDLPVGTWMTAFFPTDKTVLTEDLLSKVKGFSIEGWFYHEEVKNEINNNDMLSKLNDVLKQLQSTLGLVGKSQVKQKIYKIKETEQEIQVDEVSGKAYFMNADGTYRDTYPIWRGLFSIEEGVLVVESEKAMIVEGATVAVTQSIIRIFQKVMTVAETGSAIFMNDETMICNFINADGSLGELVPVGSYILEDGSTLVVTEGSVGSIVTEENQAIVEAEVAMSAAKVELEKLVAQNTAIKNELASLKAELEAVKKTAQTVVLPDANAGDKGKETQKTQMSEVEYINSKR